MDMKLRPELAAFVEKKKRSDEFHSIEAAVNEAVGEWRWREEEAPLQPAGLERLRQEVQRGVDQADRGEYADFTADDIAQAGFSEHEASASDGAHDAFVTR